MFRKRGVLRSLGRAGSAAATHIFGQTFIRRRSKLRWWMHQLIFWGCVLAVLITFPLVFGWIHFETLPDDQMRYVAFLFGFPAGTFQIRRPLSIFPRRISMSYATRMRRSACRRSAPN